MTIRAGNEMDVVWVGRVEVRGFHRLHVKATIGQSWMAVGTRTTCIVGVGCMACGTAQTLMDASGYAIVTAASLAEGVGSMTLYADALAYVGGHLNTAVVVS